MPDPIVETTTFFKVRITIWPNSLVLGFKGLIALANKNCFTVVWMAMGQLVSLHLIPYPVDPLNKNNK